MKTLEELLRMTVKGVDGVSKGIVAIHPSFRISVQEAVDPKLERGHLGGVRIIVHADGYNSDTLDYWVQGDMLIPLQDFPNG